MLSPRTGVTGMPIELSVVVPVHGCAPCLDELWARTTAVLDELVEDHEIVFVDDASPDAAAGVLAKLADGDPRVVVISLTENQGQHAAIAIGLARARGRWTAVMDGDLQDPPEVLRAFWAVAREAEIVVGRRRRIGQPVWRRLAGRVFVAFLRARHGTRLVGTHSVFSLLSPRARERYLVKAERFVMYLPVLEALGLPIVSIEYDRAPRAAGKSSYGLRRLVGHAWGVFSSRSMARHS